MNTWCSQSTGSLLTVIVCLFAHRFCWHCLIADIACILALLAFWHCCSANITCFLALLFCCQCLIAGIAVLLAMLDCCSAGNASIAGIVIQLASFTVGIGCFPPLFDGIACLLTGFPTSILLLSWKPSSMKWTHHLTVTGAHKNVVYWGNDERKDKTSIVNPAEANSRYQVCEASKLKRPRSHSMDGFANSQWSLRWSSMKNLAFRMPKTHQALSRSRRSWILSKPRARLSV